MIAKLFNSPSLVGLDFQPEALHLVQLGRRRQGYVVERLASHALTEQKSEDAIISSYLANFLPLLQGQKVLGKAVAISLAVDKVLFRRLRLLSGLAETEIFPEIISNLKREIALDDFQLDFNILPSMTMGYIDVGMVLAPKQYIEQWVTAVTAAGLKVKIVDVDIYAIKRAVCHSLRWVVPEGQLGAIVYVAAEQAILIGFDAQLILFHSVFSLESNSNFASLLQQRLQTALSTYQLLTVHQLAVCGVDVHRVQGLSGIQCNDPFHGMQFDLGVANIEESDLSHYWLACGLALRQVPRW